jgi:iron-sulfur cluster assembly accessory protein
VRAAPANHPWTSRTAQGCSGFQYAYLLERAGPSEGDAVFQHAEHEGARVVVDEFSLELLRGSTIDFQEDMMKSAFLVVGNPQAEAACGCGSSFQALNPDLVG